MKETFLEFLLGNKEQRKNGRIFGYELLLIIGAVFFGQGIIALMPPEWVGGKEWGAIGLVLILIAILSYKTENKKQWIKNG